MPRYNDNILNYYNDDSHIGSFDVADKNVGTGLVGSPSCGDVMKLQIKIKQDDKTGEKIIDDAKILVFGCGSAKASSSYVAEQLVGKTLKEAMNIKNTDIAKFLGLPKIKLHCSVLAESAIKRAIEDYDSKNAGELSNIGDSANKKKESHKANVTIQDEKSDIDKELSFSISKDAIKFVKHNLEKLNKDVQGIRLGLEEGHCGLMYKVRYVLKNDDVKDYISYQEDGLVIFVKKEEKQILNGTKIEYKEEGLKRGLIFTNPKETGKCSCGLNFFTAEKKQKE